MQEQNNDKKPKSDKISETVAQDAKLQKEIFDVCETLDGHAEAIGEQMFNAMLEHLNEQYLREYALLNADKLIDVDKQIVELKIKREKELAEIEERRVKQEREIAELKEQQRREFELEKAKAEKEFEIEKTKELAEIEELKEQQRREFELEKAKAEKEFEIEKTKELGEMQIEHDRVKADIERQRTKLATELEIWKQTNEEELRAKAERVVPSYKLRRRFLGIPIGRLKPNQAWLLAMESADIETREYLVSRAQEIAERKAKAFELNFEVQEEAEELSEEPTDEMQQDSAPINKKDRKALLKKIKRLSKTESGKKLMTDIAAALDAIQPQEPSEPVFVPEALTESELKLYLQNLERKDYLEYKAQCKAEKAELKRLKKKAKKAKKSKTKEAKPPETQAEPNEAPAADQVKIDDNNSE